MVEGDVAAFGTEGDGNCICETFDSLKHHCTRLATEFDLLARERGCMANNAGCETGCR